MTNKQFRAWSGYGPGLLRDLEVEVHVAAPVGGPSVEQDDPRKCRGIWDTGATGVVITQGVVDDLGLKPVGKAVSHTGNGTVTGDTYYISLRLPNGILLDTEAICMDVPSCDVLVGMSVISRGDFAVTNMNGKTTVTFRVPSCETIDYVKEADKQNKQVGKPQPYRRARFGKPKKRKK